MSNHKRRPVAFRPDNDTLESRDLAVGGYLGQIGGIIGQIPGVIGQGPGDGGTGFVGYSKVKRVYSASYTIENDSSRSIKIKLYSDTSKGKTFTIGAGETGSFTSRWTTTYKVGGSTGAAPASESESLKHPYFTLNGRTYTISKNDAFTWTGSQMRRSQVV